METLITLTLAGLLLGVIGSLLQDFFVYSEKQRQVSALDLGRQALEQMRQDVQKASQLTGSYPASSLSLIQLVDLGNRYQDVAGSWNPQSGSAAVSYYVNNGLFRQQDSNPADLLCQEVQGLQVTQQGNLMTLQLSILSQGRLTNLTGSAFAWAPGR